jgi:amylosucrase
MNSDIVKFAEISRQRIRPRMENAFRSMKIRREGRRIFLDRMNQYWLPLFDCLYQLYGQRYDFFYHLEETLKLALRYWNMRSESLHYQDAYREEHPDWYLQQDMVGGALYVDLFSENLPKLKEHIPYFKKLKLRYIHLMPLFAVRAGDNDGGYAVNNYRAVQDHLGTLDDLKDLAAAFHREGISLVLDFILNHTSDEHDWARAAKSGNIVYQDYYFMFDDRRMPDEYEKNLREIFPTVRRGNFTWCEETHQWVWTTFNSFQWDLNYANPDVFRAMSEEMLFLANVGVDILRLDAVPFIWKKMGTNCENLPEVHTVVKAMNLMLRLAAPGTLFKSEAIVHPDEVVKYISTDECQVSYNPLLMSLLWESLATRSVRLLDHSLRRRHRIPPGCTWANYLRCHDDIGWTFDDQDAAAVGLNAYDHRQFLNRFYSGQFPGSFARGVPFQYNPATGDMRISGTLASLAGLEQALEEQDDLLVEMAVRRILLLRGIIMGIGGFPLLYLGEEWGQLNDYSYITDPAKAGDSRWIHRPKVLWEFVKELDVPKELSERIFRELRHLIELRCSQPAMYGTYTEVIETDNPHVLGFLRQSQGQRILVIANFTERTQHVDGNRLRLFGSGRRFRDLITDAVIPVSRPLELDAYQMCWLVPDNGVVKKNSGNPHL